MFEPTIQLRGRVNGRDVWEMNLDGHTSNCFPSHPEESVQSLGVGGGTVSYCNSCRSFWFTHGPALTTNQAVAVVRKQGAAEFVWWEGSDHMKLDGDFGALDLEQLALVLRSGPPPAGGYKCR